MMNTIVKGVTNSVVNVAPAAIIIVRIDETTDADVMIGPTGMKQTDAMCFKQSQMYREFEAFFLSFIFCLL